MARPLQDGAPGGDRRPTRLTLDFPRKNKRYDATTVRLTISEDPATLNALARIIAARTDLLARAADTELRALVRRVP